MGLPDLKHAGYTLADWASWEGRWELINGVAFDMTPAPNMEHQQVSVNLTVRIANALEEAKRKSGSGACAVFAAPTDVYLESGVVEPDLLVVCDQRKISQRGIEGAPDLVVEILSPSTAGKDWSYKRWAYEAAGVPEYLIVDPDACLGVLLRLEAGKYQEAARIEWSGAVPLLGGQITIAVD